MKEYTMNEQEYNDLLEACRPVCLVMTQCGSPASPQENANRAWQLLGDKMGFVWDTVKGTGKYTFNAEPKPEKAKEKNK